MALNRKPKYRCEIRVATGGVGEVYLRLEIVTGTTDHEKRVFLDNFSAKTAAALRLFKPWLCSHRVVCDQSRFETVTTAKALLNYNTRFIGVVKNASSECPVDYFAGQEIQSRCQYVSTVCQRDGKAELVPLMWQNKEGRYFISSCFVISTGKIVTRERRKAEGETTKKIELQVKILEVA